MKNVYNLWARFVAVMFITELDTLSLLCSCLSNALSSDFELLHITIMIFCEQ